MASSKIADRNAKYRNGSASALAAQIAGDPKVLDFSDPGKRMQRPSTRCARVAAGF
ncbi:MAG: hypothetical protein ACLVK4_14425 [Alistipes shahii]|uniref:hypothetical protein n=1 Tax=Alistipes shahii TaxID=328814 RepID=UPI00399D0AE8